MYIVTRAIGDKHRAECNPCTLAMAERIRELLNGNDPMAKLRVVPAPIHYTEVGDAI